MFTKKQSLQDIASLSTPFNKLSLNPTHIMNHQFFLLVRDQRYEQAYKLGQVILAQNPDNPSIEHFCEFIRNNGNGLKEMLEEQEYETDQQDGQEEEDDDQEEDDQQQDQQEQVSKDKVSVKKIQPFSQRRAPSQSIVSKTYIKPATNVDSKKVVKPQQPSTSKQQVSAKQLNKQNAHKWDHTCKNPNCPNKKPHKH